jgi:hydroxymethylglutaryl-CoA lyase
MGVGTGIDLDRLIAAATAAQDLLGHALTSHSLVAGPVPWAPAGRP